MQGKRGEGWEGRGRLTCLPPRFDNPGYGPISCSGEGKRMYFVSVWRTNPETATSKTNV